MLSRLEEKEWKQGDWLEQASRKSVIVKSGVMAAEGIRSTFRNCIARLSFHLDERQA